jgi:hypothetical protein
MSNRKLTHAVQQLFQQAGRMAKAFNKGLMSWLLRGLLLLGRQPLLSRAGFVLPTVVLLLLVVSLTVGSLTFRTLSRTQEAIGERQQRVIYNAATPAIDRAKAKLEFMFDNTQDTRYPGGVPRELYLLGMMLNDGRDLNEDGFVVPHFPEDQPDVDPYTFPGETRLNLSNEGGLASIDTDNAWSFPVDLDNDGTVGGPNDGVIAYSILFQTPPDQSELRLRDPIDVLARSRNLQVRNGPLSNIGQPDSACLRFDPDDPGASDFQAERGWFRDPSSGPATLRKNFQVNALVKYNDTAKTTVATLEFSQDRKINRGNKWGAWFRNDLEIFPGDQLNWNGAMHTEGSLIAGGAGTKFRSFLISSPGSCLYSKENSEITVGNYATTTAADGTPINGEKLFQGQAIAATVRDSGNDGGTTYFDIFSDPNPIQATAAETQFVPTKDSVLGSTPAPVDYTLDPVVLQTKGESAPRGAESANPMPQRDPLWQGEPESFPLKGRIYNQREEAPYVDDSYRADNRYGPKPKFRNELGKLQDIPGFLGDRIADVPVLTALVAPGSAEEEPGLDGYWERRARAQGLRVIVGQRLELGNPFGWNFGINETAPYPLKEEPLRPWSCTAGGAGCTNQARQRRTLYDNLAAVQATAIYHAFDQLPNDDDSIDTPLACLATTVHPGTGYTLERSATFENLNYDLAFDPTAKKTPSFTYPGGNPANFPLINTDFFRGRGTNGWEFAPPDIEALKTASTPLRLALQNLAYFAGDPYGGAPSFMNEGLPAGGSLPDNRVHPYPSLAMWGDYSILRRVLKLMETGSYDDLSPADKATLHTASCTLGMLAYNIQYLRYYNPYGNTSLLTRLRAYIDALPTLSPPSPTITTPPSQSSPPSTPEEIIAGLEKWRDKAILNTASLGEIEELNRMVYTAQMIMTREQVIRDLEWGFIGSPGASAIEYSDDCSGILASSGLLSLCSSVPHYPILYSLFPTSNHGDLTQKTRDSRDLQTPNLGFIGGINSGSELYKEIATTPDSLGDNAIGLIALKPRTLDQWQLPHVTGVTGDNPNNNRDTLIRVCADDKPCMETSYLQKPLPGAGGGGQLVQVGFKDSALFNGRELLSVRVLDMNLELMRNNGDFLVGGDRWLPKSGIIYAFREDAVSESGIVRKKTGDFISCDTEAKLRTATCWMNTAEVDANSSTDPPLNPENLISPKPVDYFPDPDRRPNGFRLRKGIDLGRPGDQGRGMTLVSDNPVYIQGNFNLHQDDGGVALEEFNPPLLSDTYSNFYNRTGVNGKFAQYTEDRWRPAEILADAITILSDNFCDGSAQDAILTAAKIDPATVPISMGPAGTPTTLFSTKRYGCQGNPTNITSYLTLNRPNSNPTPSSTTFRNRWLRVNKGETIFRDDTLKLGYYDDGRSPIRINQVGNPIRDSGTPYTATSYYPISKPEYRSISATPNAQRVNAILVSGIVPSRTGQSYGGLQNFPRFLENWEGKRLYISGAFIQLNFSSYATGPFDQDRFDVSASLPLEGKNANEYNKYYAPPTRRWGYDVGLQYAPAGPLAQRFITLEKIRSEFYDEPPADDPYISNLCSALPVLPDQPPIICP